MKLCVHFNILNCVLCLFVHLKNYIELTSRELISWEVDLVGVDLVGVDLVGIDLVEVDLMGFDLMEGHWLTDTEKPVNPNNIPGIVVFHNG